MLKKGDTLILEIDDLAHGGDGVGHLKDGLAVFVPTTMPGDKVKIRVKNKKRNYIKGEFLEVIEPAQARIKPDCPVFYKCGGCQIQQIDYPKQLELKENMVKEIMKRIGGISNIELCDIIGSDDAWRYRNKAQFPLATNDAGEIIAGFFQRGTHKITPFTDCLIQHPLINRILKETLQLLNEYQISVYNERKHRGLLRHLLIRTGVCTNQALLTIVARADKIEDLEEIADKLSKKIPELGGIILNINSGKTNVITGDQYKTIKGKDFFIDYIGKIKYQISAASFFQVNTIQAHKLYEVVKEMANLNGDESIIDAYCGIGSIGLYLAKNAGKIFGIEIVPEAIVNAQQNAKLNGIDNANFIRGKVENRLDELLETEKIDIIIFDPPRKGLDENMLKKVISSEIEKIIYVSCNPATQARDLKLLKDYYNIIEMQPVDMFPQTYHVENVALLTKK